ncbi:MAG TPA: dihydroorotate dehydrogenase electron transfer subunit [Persephonella sp.]|uniref:Dihydroorotate dehydrogenase electron transfer subunit n=1 Tax=Persephonella marina (strain DSM 14350 / EX-H1) TaxID=123214 RepID=C0QR58_PERMH|nr:MULTISPECIES: dihydroorotate dehydrogenase electron transfer subunit [Persephonella]ACO04938.1 dihydroorotate dehydrogenase electron transfer subunit [Persephonella marina EX-H1]HCB68901.1 dihydroorotate dehydrogenase electron transfer subunit [Persephonella sp.]
MIYDRKYKIVENRYISGITWLLRVKAPELKDAPAGSFVMVRSSEDYLYDPMMRRAFAIADIQGDDILIFYDVYGKGTRALTEKKEGEEINILAPLGRNFFPENFDHYILVGGGIGFAGLSLFMRRLKEKGRSFKAIYGVRRKEQLSMLEWIEENGFKDDVIVYTEDGSYGIKGLVTKDLEDLIKEKENTALMVCGPKGMMKAVMEVAKKTETPAYLSLESKMACGFGICIGCVVKDTESNSYVRVCYEGPVFDGHKIQF